MGEVLTDYGPWLGGVGAVVTVLALAFAVWAWARPKKGRLLCGAEDLPLGLPEDGDLEVRFHDKLVKTPRIVVVTLLVGRGADLTPAHFQGGHLRIIGHGIDILGPLGETKDWVRVNSRTSRGSRGFAVVDIEPCIVQAGKPVELALLAQWRSDWVPNPALPKREITKTVRAGFRILSAEIASTTEVKPTPFLEIDSKLGNFKVVTPDQVAAQRSRLAEVFLSAAQVGRF